MSHPFSIEAYAILASTHLISRPDRQVESVVRSEARQAKCCAHWPVTCVGRHTETGTREPVTAIPQTNTHHITKCRSDSHLDIAEVIRGPGDHSDHHEDLHRPPGHQPGPGHCWRHQQAVHHLQREHTGCVLLSSG